jgi:hypothetical protein
MSELKVGDLVYYHTNSACELTVVVSVEPVIEIVTSDGSRVEILDHSHILRSSFKSSSYLYKEAVASLRLFERRALNLACAIQILKSKQQTNDE